ncbi:EpsG family protein [Paenibacillus donghaensis]|uniref:EpsG family protein n=1 Tax=Paenibacillus donghaensis TaxID=414771 RepID=A0A2Z2KMN1_9BACL|nr:EpsG family protein [Paenibacillus donghaensis]ASA23809.1 hypothetical protein B9T62_25315 [Paenibacillus donghaensis]
MHILLIGFILLGGFVINNTVQSKAKEKILAIWTGTLLFIYAALRSVSVGTDIESYSLSYLQLKYISFEEIFMSNTIISRDPFFYFFLKLLTYINSDPQFMLVVISALITICITIFIYKNSVNIILSCTLFVGLRYYSFTLSGLRQALAWGIIMLSYNYIKEKKPVNFILLIILAALFHKSALIFLLAYPLASIKKLEIITISVPFVYLLNVLTNNGVMQLVLKIPFFKQYEDYGGYLLGNSNNSGSTLILIYVSIYVIAFIFRKQVISNNDNIYLMYNLTLLGITITMLSIDYENLFRIGYYFIFPIILLLPLTINSIGDKKMRNILNAFVILLVFGQYILIGPGAGTDNYHFFWEWNY